MPRERHGRVVGHGIRTIQTRQYPVGRRVTVVGNNDNFLPNLANSVSYRFSSDRDRVRRTTKFFHIEYNRTLFEIFDMDRERLGELAVNSVEREKSWKNRESETLLIGFAREKCS